MPVNREAYRSISLALNARNIRLVAVSKTKTPADIKELYGLGHRDFGENYVQELTEKQAQLPTDIRWHFIGHLQSNKVKYIAPFVHLVHGVDSLKLLNEIDKQARKNDRAIDCLLQVHIASEETKFGLNETELDQIMQEASARVPSARITGLMGMSTLTNDLEIVRSEFRRLKALFDRHSSFTVLSMGMSNDYEVAVEEGSNMVRIGSLLFGERH